ncbi:intercellular trafficking and secretion [Spiromyces aspiralis]|uniref:Intercellular trafficking and secretion n=1 Tax=Spiromyces aspiralis TaxID=68401 RepID=A0ACC1HH06_9FUNG|nr:intercellular trafficking and secretion [Spiromyces aspiralis]
MQDTGYDSVQWETLHEPPIRGDTVGASPPLGAKNGVFSGDNSEWRRPNRPTQGERNVRGWAERIAAARVAETRGGMNRKEGSKVVAAMPDVQMRPIYLAQHFDAEGTSAAKHEVRRRFQDFVWLHEELIRDFPSCVIPPLPGKHIESKTRPPHERSRMHIVVYVLRLVLPVLEYFVGDRFGEEFVTRRMLELERFLQRVAIHPLLKSSPKLVMFLEAKEWRSEYEDRTKGDVTVLDKVGDTLLNTLSKVRNKDERFAEIAENIEKLHSHLSSVSKLYAKVAKRNTKLQQAYGDFGVGLEGIGSLETGIMSSLVAAGAALRQHSQLLGAEAIEDQFLTEIDEYVQYCDSYKHTLKVRDQKQAESEDLEEYLQSTHAEHNRLINYQPPQGMSAVTSYIRGKVRDLRGLDRNIDRQKRIHSLKERIDELDEALNISTQESKACSQQVLDEYEIFLHIKRQDMRRCFSALARSHIDFYRKSSKVWQDLLPEIQKITID